MGPGKGPYLPDERLTFNNLTMPFGHMHEPGCGPDATAFIQMTDDVCSFGLWKLGVEQGAAPSLGELLPTDATAEQTETVVPIHLPDDEVIGPSVAKQLAFGIDAGESVHVGSLHEDLLENS